MKRTCLKDDCESAVRSRGLCERHYNKARWSGTIDSEGREGQCAGSTGMIDHCHERGHVRGILCRRCNFGLGLFDDAPDRLRRASKYLERYRESAS